MTPIAVVLAAGSGRRLQPVTDHSPKCLIDIAGKPLLGRMLDSFAEARIREVVIVTGYLSSRIEAFVRRLDSPLEIALTRNEAFDTTNNAASLFTARSLVGARDFVLCDGDVIFSRNPIPALLEVPDACALAVDPGARLGDEEMKVQLDAGGRVRRLSKRLPPGQCAAESIGIQKIGGEGRRALWAVLEQMMPLRAADAYYEEAFQTLIDRGVQFGTSPVDSSSWMEIDDLADLNAARERFASL